MQTIYGVRGERRLEEYEIPWLSGYEDSKPVRIGNAASNQFQLDVYGEVLAALWQAHHAGIKMTEPDWALQVALMNFWNQTGTSRTREFGKCAAAVTILRIPK